MLFWIGTSMFTWLFTRSSIPALCSSVRLPLNFRMYSFSRSRNSLFRWSRSRFESCMHQNRVILTVPVISLLYYPDKCSQFLWSGDWLHRPSYLQPPFWTLSLLIYQIRLKMAIRAQFRHIHFFCQVTVTGLIGALLIPYFQIPGIRAQNPK
jgi:hypothetical protein